jgi:hypothetical protein
LIGHASGFVSKMQKHAHLGAKYIATRLDEKPVAHGVEPVARAFFDKLDNDDYVHLQAAPGDYSSPNDDGLYIDFDSISQTVDSHY